MVFHEDFLTDPRGVLQSLLDQLGTQASPPNLDALRTGIPFQGNRLVRKDVVSLQTLEARERSGGSPIDRFLVAALSRLRPRAYPAAAGQPPRSRAASE